MSNNNERITISIEVPEGASLPDILESIALDAEDDDAGYAHTSYGDAAWRIKRPQDGVELDPRQREAAALILCAFDLPQNMLAAAQTMLEACDVNPGMKMPHLTPNNRQHCLKAARALLDEMLVET